jgi:hypothetical protein
MGEDMFYDDRRECSVSEQCSEIGLGTAIRSSKEIGVTKTWAGSQAPDENFPSLWTSKQK